VVTEVTGFAGTERFRVVRQLGAGGMGVVYEAHDVEKDERVALKTLQTMDAEALFRFKREFRTLHGIEHPNLVRLGELVEHEGIWFFTMELVPGTDFLGHVWTRDWREEARMAAVAQTIDHPKLASPAGEGEAPLTSLPPFDDAKLRRALHQLAAAIATVHGAGKVHRDIKPSNVSVAPDGRVVLLDFGLITGTEQGDRSTVAGLCGTPEYMAPEQISDGRVGPPADWYSFGVILYEALTGRLPVKGTAVSIMADKLRVEPAAPRTLSPDVPPDLEALCVELLRIDPNARPVGRDILARIALGGVAGGESAVSDPLPSASPFIGRKTELAELDSAWSMFRREGRAATLFVDSVSGMGKSALLTAFRRRLAEADGATVILEGRGYQHESIPYNAFDHVIDALSRHLRSLSAAKAAALMPRNAWLLPRLFPILGRVGPISRLTRAMTLELDAQELRTRCFSAFRELLARIAERQPLLVILDDLQWAGRDSLMLLGEIIRPPDPPPMFLVLASRERDLPDPYARPQPGSTKRWWALPDDIVRISLGPLPPDDARTLAAALVDRAGEALAATDPVAIATEAEGHPLLMQELVRYAALGGPRAADHPRLDDAVRARTRALPALTHRVLSLAVLAAVPIAREVLAHAATLDMAALADELGVLEKMYLVRPARVHVEAAVEPFHDRVREAVLADLGAEERRARHVELAAAYALASSPDAVQLTRHLVAAGEGAQAAETALRAAEEAEYGLAFDRAAEHYKLALELRKGDRSRHDIRIKFAEALARAGRCAEAATVYEAASREASGAVALELQGCAAQQLVRAGEFEQGITRVRELLASIGVRVPGGGRWTLVRILALRAVVRVRSLWMKAKPADTVAVEAKRRVDLLHDLAATTSGVDVIIGAWLTARALLEAIRVGDRVRLSRALSAEAAWVAGAAGGWTKRAEGLMASARALEDSEGKKLGWSDAMTGAIEFTSARFSAALAKLRMSHEVFIEQPDAVLDLAGVHIFSTFTLYTMGNFSDLRELVAPCLRAALDSGDRHQAAFHRLGHGNLATWLAIDQPARALAEASAAEESWSRDRFDMIAFLALLARVDIALYTGDAELALKVVTDAWAPLEGSMLLALPWFRLWALDAHSRAALACALASPSRRSELVPLVESIARTLLARRLPTGAPRAMLLRAGLAAMKGDAAEERRELEDAVAAFEKLEMGAHTAAARRRLGVLRGGDEGLALVATAAGWFHGQHVVRPESWVQMLAPSAAKLLT